MTLESRKNEAIAEINSNKGPNWRALLLAAVLVGGAGGTKMAHDASVTREKDNATTALNLAKEASDKKLKASDAKATEEKQKLILEQIGVTNKMQTQFAVDLERANNEGKAKENAAKAAGASNLEILRIQTGAQIAMTNMATEFALKELKTAADNGVKDLTNELARATSSLNALDGMVKTLQADLKKRIAQEESRVQLEHKTKVKNLTAELKKAKEDLIKQGRDSADAQAALEASFAQKQADAEGKFEADKKESKDTISEMQSQITDLASKLSDSHKKYGIFQINK